MDPFWIQNPNVAMLSQGNLVGLCKNFIQIIISRNVISANPRTKPKLTSVIFHTSLKIATNLLMSEQPVFSYNSIFFFFLNQLRIRPNIASDLVEERNFTHGFLHEEKSHVTSQ